MKSTNGYCFRLSSKRWSTCEELSRIRARIEAAIRNARNLWRAATKGLDSAALQYYAIHAHLTDLHSQTRLGNEELDRIIDIELKLATANMPFFTNVTGSARKFLLAEGIDLRYGARPLKRGISYESPSLTFSHETRGLGDLENQWGGLRHE